VLIAVMVGRLRVALKFSLIDCLDGWISQVSSDAGPWLAISWKLYP
jgi:hypothetical protein